jgi:hypothetical protein
MFLLSCFRRNPALTSRAAPAKAIFTLCIALFSAAPVWAGKTLILDETTPSALIKQVEGMKQYAKELSGERVQREFLTDIESLLNRLATVKSFNGLPANESTEIANDYESLRARADGGDAKTERRICERVRRTGTHMVTTICLTASQRARNAEKAKESMIELQRRTNNN